MPLPAAVVVFIYNVLRTSDVQGDVAYHLFPGFQSSKCVE